MLAWECSLLSCLINMYLASTLNSFWKKYLLNHVVCNGAEVIFIYLFSTNNINSCSSLENCQGSLQQSKETDITIQILSKHYHYPNKSCGNSSGIVNPFISIGLLSKPAPPPPHTHTWGLEYAVLWKYYGCAVLLPWDCLMCLSLHISLITETNEDCF